MASSFLGEIRIFAGNFAPSGWALCNGQLLPVSENKALYSLLGTTYGGDGINNFALPDLQGAAALAAGYGPGLSKRRLASNGGERYVTLTNAGMPSHQHPVYATTELGTCTGPGDNVWAQPAAGRGTKAYQTSNGTGPAMNPAAFAAAGGGQPHNNMPPYLVLNFMIALEGETPVRG